jgi:hypothetical protein
VNDERDSSIELARALAQLAGAIAKLEDRRSEYPKWWHTWFSPATVVAAFTAIGTIISVTWVTSARLNTIELKVPGLEQRAASMEGSMVTKDWLTRELSYQREQMNNYASKGSVDLITQRLEEFQRQLNVIEGLARTNKGNTR